METVNITVRGVPAEVRDRLAQRASATGASMQGYLLRQLCLLAARPTMDEWAERAGEQARTRGASLTVEQILEARDAGRK